MLYFGRDILCGLDPPVLMLKFIGPSLSEYVCVVGDGSGGGAGGANATATTGQAHDPVSLFRHVSGFFVIYFSHPKKFFLKKII